MSQLLPRCKGHARVHNQACPDRTADRTAVSTRAHAYGLGGGEAGGGDGGIGGGRGGSGGQVNTVHRTAPTWHVRWPDGHARHALEPRPGAYVS
eukprot:360870-Chlamydomonas_euryale.AAC.24